VPLIIAGQETLRERQIRSANPNDPEEIVGSVSVAGKPEAEQAVAAARKAFPGWRDTPPEKRAEYLFRAAAIARERRRDLAALQVFEAGKTWSEADADVCEAIDFLDYYAREMVRLAQPRRMGHVPGEHSVMFYEPRGVACVIAPWNFPLAISTGMASAALVTGNTVIYKPSSETPVIGYQLVELFRAAGLPDGVLNYLPGPGGEVGDYLVTHPEVAMISFTGSKDVGLRIIRLAGETPEGAMGIKRVVAELGGKNAIIVDSDADLDEAVAEILHSAFGYQGQKCSACSRLIVLEEIYPKLIERLIPAADSLYLGPAEDPRSYMGAVISESARKKVESYIEIGKKEGKLLLEKRPKEAKGHFAPLTIFEGIRPGDRLAQEEIFGPVLAILKAKDMDEALDIANGTPYALTGGIFSRSPENVEKAKKAFRVGNLYINRGCTGALVERHPFGGFKMSGIGSKAGGPDYLQQFMVPRNIVENTMRRGFAPEE
jgi:RHH-type proline utilization regulon transcriptional repressor/proline dehydrogenase/delta 1-pyrroline-5-carboxylate dehydrogenase